MYVYVDQIEGLWSARPMVSDAWINEVESVPYTQSTQHLNRRAAAFLRHHKYPPIHLIDRIFKIFK